MGLLRHEAEPCHVAARIGQAGDEPGSNWIAQIRGDDRPLSRLTGRVSSVRRIPMPRLAARTFAEIAQNRPLQLVDLTGPGLSQIGADGRLTTSDYRLSQRWVLAFYEHPHQPDCILYRSRHDPSRFCAAIFDRAEDALTATSLGSLADEHNAALLADLLDMYEEYSLIVP